MGKQSHVDSRAIAWTDHICSRNDRCMATAIAAREATATAGDEIDGRYRIVKCIGEGGMGTVYLAEHMLIKRRVAVKILHPEFANDATVIERFMNEARAAGTLGHPNIVESTDMGFTAANVPYIVFEYLEGSLLTDEIYRCGGMPVPRAARIAQKMASALQAAHSAGIVHRDLKSDNIFLTDKDDAMDHVKVLDFGISRFLEVDDEQTKRGMIMGTPEFMAPEQIIAPNSVDGRADIYALGVILYEMLAAKRPFQSDDPRTLLHRIVHNDPPPLERADVPPSLLELIMSLLQKEPADRLPTMTAVEAALAEFVPVEVRPSRPRVNGSDPTELQIEARMRRASVGHDTSRPQRPPSLGLATVALPTPVPRRRKSDYRMPGLVAAAAVVGLSGWIYGLTRSSSSATAASPTSTTPASVTLRVIADAPQARVTFRHRNEDAGNAQTLAANNVFELLEVTAPGRSSIRYWVKLDRALTLVADLPVGNGVIDATDAQTSAALGKAAPAAGLAVGR